MSAIYVDGCLLWTNDVYHIFKNKSCSSHESKFDMVKYLFSGEALEELTTVETKIDNKLIVDDSSSDKEKTK